MTAPSGSTVRALLHVFFFMTVETTPVINDDNLSGMVSPFLPFWLLSVVLISQELLSVNLWRTLLYIRYISEIVTSRIQTVESQDRRSGSGWVTWRCVVLHVCDHGIKCFCLDYLEELHVCLVFLHTSIFLSVDAMWHSLNVLQIFWGSGCICGIRVWFSSAQEGETEAKATCGMSHSVLAEKNKVVSACLKVTFLLWLFFIKVFRYCLLY